MSDEYSSASSNYDDDDDDGGGEGENGVPLSLKECGKCGRRFNEEAFMRHSKICDKVNKPRKQFDSKKQRLEQFQNEVIQIKSTSSSAPKKIAKKKDWRRQHEEFIKTIRSARSVTKAQKTGGELPPPPSPTFNPDYIQCPYCERRFGEAAAERHIEFCKQQKSRLPKLSSDTKFEQKKTKVEKRTQYRPPVPGQKKTSSDSNSSAKLHGRGNATPGFKLGSSPGTKKENIPQLERNAKSDSAIVADSKKLNKPVWKDENDERPLNNNSRYSKTTRVSSGSSVSDNERLSSKKNKTGDPKWFEDLKRDSAGKTRTQSNFRYGIDEKDFGLDMNDNFKGQNNGRKSHPVGVVQPSSRSKEKEMASDSLLERDSAGRRKLANFCHDCGAKYPITNAKFCCECGVRRMAIS